MAVPGLPGEASWPAGAAWQKVAAGLNASASLRAGQLRYTWESSRDIGMLGVADYDACAAYWSAHAEPGFGAAP